MFCGLCGESYRPHFRGRCQCTGQREKRICDNDRTVHIDEMEARVLAGLKRHLAAPELVSQFIRDVHDELRRQQTDQAGERQRLKRRQGHLTGRIERIVEVIADGSDRPALRAKLLELEQEKAAVDAELTAAGEATVLSMHPNLASVYERKVAKLHEVLTADDQARQEAANVIRGMIDRVLAYPL